MVLLSACFTVWQFHFRHWTGNWFVFCNAI